MSNPLYMIAGRLGVTEGMHVTAGDTISEHDDGAPSGITYKVDISHLLSEQLGKQMSMMATYRVKYLQVSFRNVDDVNDNDYGMFAGGLVNWYSPTKHRIDALQYCRDYKRKIGYDLDIAGQATDPFSAFASSQDYKGLRFGMEGDSDVASATSDDTSALVGTYFSLAEIFDKYNLTIAGTPTQEGKAESGEGMALWNTRVGENEFDSLYWQTYIRNSQMSDDTIGITMIFQPEISQWTWQSDANHLPVLGGLLEFTVNQTNTDNPRALDTNDDYNIQLVVGVEGWSGF